MLVYVEKINTRHIYRRQKQDQISNMFHIHEWLASIIKGNIKYANHSHPIHDIHQQTKVKWFPPRTTFLGIMEVMGTGTGKERWEFSQELSVGQVLLGIYWMYSEWERPCHSMYFSNHYYLIKMAALYFIRPMCNTSNFLIWYSILIKWHLPGYNWKFFSLISFSKLNYWAFVDKIVPIVAYKPWLFIPFM